MTDRPRVLVVQNSPTSGPRRFGAWWAADGLDLDVRLGPEGTLPESIDGYDALVMLGGGYLPDEDDRAPWLATERALAVQAIDAGMPTLGICLGGQLLAQVAGGAVAGKHGRPERGSTPIELAHDAGADALLHGIPARIRMIENHEDSITRLPDDAVLLASSADHPYQAFRLGARVWGLQFHPEAAAPELAAWNEAAFAAEGLDLAAIRAQAEVAEPEAEPVARAIAGNFAAVVRGA